VLSSPLPLAVAGLILIASPFYFRS